MPITALPTPPSRTDAANFNARAEAFLGALPTFATDANALATTVNTSATNAGASATTASTQATNAATSATSAAASYDAFDDRYLGSKAANPTIDNDGAALLTGALHWNTTAAEMRVWTGTAWVAAYVSAGAYAPLASPAFTGVPTAPTAAVDTNTTQAATTAFVLAQASAAAPIIDGIAAVGTSLRYARADHAHPSDTSRAPLASPQFSGSVGIGLAPATPLDVAGRGRFLQDSVATTGAIILRQNAGDTVGGYIQWVNNANSGEKGWITVNIAGDMIFGPASTERLRITAAGIIQDASALELGYKDIPQNAKTAAYTLALADRGKHISITTGGIVIPANAAVAFPIGATIVMHNDSAVAQTISITTDILRQAGTANTGTRTLDAYGLATLIKVKMTTWVISGAGLS
jgi:hypothetical protein